MPKCYSDKERAYIIKRLKEEAAKCLAQYGIRRTTVDELVKRVKIPKGTFYLFYKAKEILLFEVILEQHDRIENQIMTAISSLDLENITCDQLTNLFFSFFKMIEEMPIINMMKLDEIEILARKLPQEILAEHLVQDRSMIQELFAALHVKPEKNVEAFSAAFRNIYFATLHREELGGEHYDDALRLLIQGLVVQLLQ